MLGKEEEWLLGAGSEHTKRAYRAAYKDFESFVAGREITSTLARQWFSDLLDRGLSNSSVNAKLSALRSYYRYLRDVGLTDRSPLYGLKRRPEVKLPKRPTVLKPVEVQQILEAARNWGLTHAVAAGLLAVGLRASEVCSVTLGDIEEVGGYWYLRVLGKGNRVRTIVLPQWLREDIELLRAEWVAHSPTLIREGSWLESPLIRVKGGGITYKQLSGWVAKWSRRARIDSVTCHALRHAAVTAMYEGGGDLVRISQYMGHRSVETTMQYLHLRDDPESSPAHVLDVLVAPRVVE